LDGMALWPEAPRGQGVSGLQGLKGQPEVGPALVWHYALGGCSGGGSRRPDDLQNPQPAVALFRSQFKQGQEVAPKSPGGRAPGPNSQSRLKSGGEMLGLVGLDDLDAYHASAELAFLLKVRFWRQGKGGESEGDAGA